MCGRFSLSSNLNDLKNEFSDDLSGNFPARYNIAPGQDSVVVSLFDKKYNLQILNKLLFKEILLCKSMLQFYL